MGLFRLNIKLTGSTMSAHKTFRIKRKLAKKLKQNRPIPQWIRMRTGNTIRYNAKGVTGGEPSSSFRLLALNFATQLKELFFLLTLLPEDSTLVSRPVHFFGKMKNLLGHSKFL